ncbi:MAG: hypothetical protein IT364_23645 [Candidatus Hydrogenedentes bacterium]|nr:hypothetical protein [Candidatus Hydrogenedentota bacterium]
MGARIQHIGGQLWRHAPFTAWGTLSGIAMVVFALFVDVPYMAWETLFWITHPVHVMLSALVTAAVYRLHSRGGVCKTIIIGYLGSVGIATISDSLIPFAGEWLLDLPNRVVHLGFIERWWLVNPLASAGIGIAFVWPHTQVSHAGHVFLSTWASLLHFTMALGDSVNLAAVGAITIFLFLAVWLPCCTSDIVLPLLFARQDESAVRSSRAEERRREDTRCHV